MGGGPGRFAQSFSSRPGFRGGGGGGGGGMLFCLVFLKQNNNNNNYISI